MTTRRTQSHEIKGPGGTLSLRPDDEAVVDLVMLIEGETSGRDLGDILDQFGRSRSTYYEKLRRFREHGLEGLLPRPPGPKTPWRRPLEVIRFVVTTRLRNPERTAAEIADELTRLGHSVSMRSVERTLSQFGLTRLRAPAAAGAGPTLLAPAGEDEVAPQPPAAATPAARTPNGTVE